MYLKPTTGTMFVYLRIGVVTNSYITSLGPYENIFGDYRDLIQFLYEQVNNKRKKSADCFTLKDIEAS